MKIRKNVVITNLALIMITIVVTAYAGSLVYNRPVTHNVDVMPENGGLGEFHLYQKLGELPLDVIEWGQMKPGEIKTLVLYLVYKGGGTHDFKIQWNCNASELTRLRILRDGNTEWLQQTWWNWHSTDVWTLHFEMSIADGSMFDGERKLSFGQLFTIQEI